MHQPLLVISDLRKGYGTRHILDRVSLELTAGNVAVIGANGAGKSTLLRVLAGAEGPDSGRIVVDGVDLIHSPRAAKRRIAYVPDEPLAYPFLFGHEFLRLIRDLRGLDDSHAADPLIDAFGLGPHLHKRFEGMSLGTQRKFFIVAALMDEPHLLMMDEPTNGLDRHAREVLIGLLRESAPWRLALFASHDEDFVTRVEARRLHLSDAQLRLEDPPPSTVGAGAGNKGNRTDQPLGLGTVHSVESGNAMQPDTVEGAS